MCIVHSFFTSMVHLKNDGECALRAIQPKAEKTHTLTAGLRSPIPTKIRGRPEGGAVQAKTLLPHAKKRLSPEGGSQRPLHPTHKRASKQKESSKAKNILFAMASELGRPLSQEGPFVSPQKPPTSSIGASAASSQQIESQNLPLASSKEGSVKRGRMGKN